MLPCHGGGAGSIPAWRSGGRAPRRGHTNKPLVTGRSGVRIPPGPPGGPWLRGRAPKMFQAPATRTDTKSPNGVARSSRRPGGPENAGSNPASETLIRPGGAARSARHPVKVEATGSNPVQGAGPVSHSLGSEVSPAACKAAARACRFDSCRMHFSSGGLGPTEPHKLGRLGSIPMTRDFLVTMKDER